MLATSLLTSGPTKNNFLQRPAALPLICPKVATNFELQGGTHSHRWLMPNGRDNAMTTVRATEDFRKFCSLKWGECRIRSHQTMPNYSTTLHHLRGCGCECHSFTERGVEIWSTGSRKKEELAQLVRTSGQQLGNA
ncbi:uncharacterized protein LOC128257313 [Drosophila gunungcola]|uniref:uncharacterized protein LOC128257313 n=1 Tax=Drosophila gunungcola TaxID=103775 RepID=UPI0022E2D6B8|nr:uncharacterized protein LOC128257313 [Drosophila gunungcola]